MSPASQAKYVIFLVFLLSVQAVLLFWNGMLMITLHEGDAMHMVQILLRMEQGEIPHKDFMTPIGILAFWPITLFMGMGVGKAYLAGNVLMAALTIPVLWWLAVSRLSTGLAYALGAAVILLMSAMVHGDILQVSSVSMYYNRWAWGVAFLVILTAVLPPRNERHQGVDGVILGLGIAALALLKATYFVTLFPPVLLAVLLRGYWTTLLVALVTGLAVIAAISLGLGVDFWAAYIGDLQQVRGAGVRSYPSQPLIYLLIGPKFLLANGVALAAVIFLRQAGRQAEGLLLLLFLPGFVFITYQNWGNDPQWLFLLGILLLALRPERATTNPMGWNMRTALGVAAALALAMIAPSALNIAASTTRYAQLDPSEFAIVLPEPRHSNLVFGTRLLYAAERRQYLTIPDEKMAALGEKFSDRRSYALYGEPLKYCKLHRGLAGFLQFFARDLQQSVPETNGRSVYVADLLSNLWMFGPTVPIPRGSPWYYGGDAGLARADYLLVPFCPSTPQVWGEVLDRLEEEGAPKFTEIRRTDTYILLRRVSG